MSHQSAFGFFVRHLPTSPFFKLACLKSVVRFFPRTKYFYLWNTYFRRAVWYSFQNKSNFCCSRTKCFLLDIFACFLGLLLNFFKQKLQCLAHICIGPQCVKVGNTLKAYQRITLSVSPSRLGIFNVPHLLQFPETHCKLVVLVSENSPTCRHCISVQASLPLGRRSSSPFNA